MESSKNKIIAIKGDVWLHKDQTSEIILSDSHSIKLGDVLVTSPAAEVTISLSANQQVHIGSDNHEVLKFDSSVEDQIYDKNEVALNISTFESIESSLFIDLVKSNNIYPPIDYFL